MKKEVSVMNRNDQDFLVQKIRTQYTEKEHTGLDELKELDSKVKRPANVFAYIFGSISAIIMGAGMSLVMTDIAEIVGIQNPMLYGIVIGIPFRRQMLQQSWQRKQPNQCRFSENWLPDHGYLSS